MWRDISKVAAESGFAAYDTAPWFDGIDMLSVVNSRVDVHPNARGHQLLASNMSKVLARDLLKPPPPTSRR
jgi:hypothetical protein